MMITLHKQACDAFYETELTEVLELCGAKQCAMEFCIETTVRVAVSRDYKVVEGSDGPRVDEIAGLLQSRASMLRDSA